MPIANQAAGVAHEGGLPRDHEGEYTHKEVKVELGTYGGAARGFGARLRDIGP